MNKQKRHQIITEMIQGERISTQKEIQERLEQQGIEVTQTTLSRDLRELGLIKNRDRGQSYYSLPNSQEDGGLGPLLGDYVRKIEQASFILVLHTQLGEAGVASNIIDREKSTHVLGTVAGADTLLVICRDEAAATALKMELEEREA